LAQLLPENCLADAEWKGADDRANFWDFDLCTDTIEPTRELLRPDRNASRPAGQPRWIFEANEDATIGRIERDGCRTLSEDGELRRGVCIHRGCDGRSDCGRPLPRLRVRLTQHDLDRKRRRARVRRNCDRRTGAHICSCNNKEAVPVAPGILTTPSRDTVPANAIGSGTGVVVAESSNVDSPTTTGAAGLFAHMAPIVTSVGKKAAEGATRKT
jgi:hypothetical protein